MAEEVHYIYEVYSEQDLLYHWMPVKEWLSPKAERWQDEAAWRSYLWQRALELFEEIDVRPEISGRGWVTPIPGLSETAFALSPQDGVYILSPVQLPWLDEIRHERFDLILDKRVERAGPGANDECPWASNDGSVGGEDQELDARE